MANSYFQFKQFTVQQDHCAMKVTTDGCLFGAWVAERVVSHKSIVISRVPEVGCLLDIGTGTGLLSLMVAQQNNDLHINAIEIDEAAAKQAKENVALSPWTERIQVMQADAKDHLYGEKYDIIISNPPFYENELKGDNKKKNLAHHQEGLLLAELLQLIKANLKEDGIFYLLLPYKRHDEIKKMIAEQELALSRLVLVRQTVNHDYFRIMLEGKPETGEQTVTMTGEIAIKDDKDQYTPEFVSLLKDYYLHL